MQNKKIETIAAEYIKLKNLVDKVRKGFGVPLGVSAEEDENSADTDVTDADLTDVSSALDVESTNGIIESYRSQNRLMFLEEEEANYFSRENLPTKLPVSGYITTRFQRGGWFVGRRHLGIDIAAERGTHIRAAGSGVVVFSDWTPDFGNLVVISHGMGIYSYYGHASRILVEQGNRVERGQVIALLGSSGFSSAPHLHFEIWKNGEPLDPELYLFARPQMPTNNG
jgi:murein DD-endopeptidase MepM/ murein hydrolase activator NlpD